MSRSHAIFAELKWIGILGLVLGTVYICAWSSQMEFRASLLRPREPDPDRMADSAPISQVQTADLR